MGTKIVYQADLARHLLKQGYQIVDIKARKDNPQSTVFVFRYEKSLMEIIKNWKK